MSNYVLGIVAHVDRSKQLQGVALAIEPDVITMDTGWLGCMGNHVSTIGTCLTQAVAGGCEWVVILEDDALPVEDFHQQLNEALDVAPTWVVSLYNGTGYPAQKQRKFAEAAASDASWILSSSLRHAVGYALHRSCFELGIIEWLERYAKDQWAPDDAITAWCFRHGEDVAYVNPSLVEHLDGPQVISKRTHLGKVTGPRRRPRHAHRVGPRLTRDDSYVRV